MPSVDLIPRLRDDLIAARFTVDALTSLWGAEADAALTRGNRVPALRAVTEAVVADPSLVPLAAVARLFLLGVEVEHAEASVALSTVGLQGADELDLIAVSDGRVRARRDLRPYAFTDSMGSGEWWIMSDLGELATGRELREDHVLGVGGASRTLSRIMIQDPVATALDLGTGCGIQAMHASRHAASVIATDISQRALDTAAFNAALNGLTSIEFRLGSLFEPVAGLRFDHIVSNPPFVITPRTEGVPSYEYRDGGLEGDAIVAAVIAEAPKHLNPGGIAQMLGNWEYRSDEDGLDRISGWLPLVPATDLWVIERERQDAPSYAETWIRDGGTRLGSAAGEALMDAWLDDFEARGVTEVGFGYVTVRHRRDALAGTVRTERVAGAVELAFGGLGEAIARTLAMESLLDSLDDEAVGRLRPVVAGDVTEVRSYWPGNEDPTVIVLRQGGGLARSISVDTGLAALVGACDGELSVGAIIEAIAQLLEADAEALRTELLPRVRALLRDGLLTLD